MGAAWVSIFVFAGRLAGAAKEMAIAYRYGVSGVADAFQLATVLVTWLPYAMTAAFSIVLVPSLVRLKAVAEREQRGFVGEIMGLVLLLGLAMGGVNLLLAMYAVPVLAANLAEETQHLAGQFIFLMTPVAVLMLLAGFYADRLIARERQINTLLEGVPAFAVTLLILIWPLADDAGPLLWGMLLGWLLQTVALAWLAQRADGAAFLPVFTRQSPHWQEFRRAALVMVAGQLVMSCVAPLDQYAAARLGDSAIAILGYATRLSGLLLSLGAIAIARSALPVLADMQAVGERVRAQALARRLALIMLLIGGVVAWLGWLCAPWLVRLLFERGAFDAVATQQVSEVLRWSLVQVPFYFAGMVLMQLLASWRQYVIIAWIAVLALIVKWVLNLALPLWLGVAGIALATGLMQACSLGCLYWAVIWLHRKAAVHLPTVA